MYTCAQARISVQISHTLHIEKEKKMREKQTSKEKTKGWFLLKQHQVAIWTLSMDFQCLFKAVKFKVIIFILVVSILKIISIQ